MLSKKLKEEILKDIKDWTKPYIALRKANPSKLTFNMWFWFSPLAFKIINYGIHILGIILFGLLSFYMLYRNLFFMVIALFLFSINFYKLVKKYNKVMPKDYNFYDLYMREY